MARGVGRLNVDLIARTAGFQAGMRKARGQMKRFHRQGKLLSGLMRKLVALFAVRQIINWGRAQAKAVDTLAKLSDRIGESTERLVGLQHAANITGAGAERMAAGLDVLQKRLGEAAMGTGEARAALDALGLSVDELMRMSPADQFGLIADRVKGLSTQAEKAAVTSKLFSRANQDLVNTLELGSAGLAKMQRRAQELGLAISRTDAAEIEKMNDAMTELKAAWDGFARTTLVTIAPAVTQMLKEIREAAQNIKALTTGEPEAPALSEAAAYYRQLIKERLKVDTAINRMSARGRERIAEAETIFAMKWREFTAKQAKLGDPAFEEARAKPKVDINTGNEEVLDRYAAFQKKLTEIAKRGQTARARLQAMQVKSIQNWATALVSLTSINANESKKSFELHKKASIAEAFVNTAAGITRAFRELPPWAAWGQAAAIGAAGAAQIAQIRATTFEGGGAAAGPTAGGEAVAAGGGEGAAPITVRASLIGDTFSGQGLRNLIDQLNEQIQDGYRIIID